MYKQADTQTIVYLKNGEAITPVKTIKDEHGGVAHFYVDDGCYVIGIENSENIVIPTYHIFPEALEILKSLPKISYIKSK